jgi:hypothetical protein
MEAILGLPSRFIHCTRYTALTDELSRLTGDNNTKFLVISSLTGILVNLTGTSEVAKAIEKAMGTLGNVIKELVRSNISLKVFIAPCTPRNIENFKELSNLLLVGDFTSGSKKNHLS